MSDPWRWHVPEDGQDCSCDGCLGAEDVEVVYRDTLRDDVVDALADGVGYDGKVSVVERRAVVRLLRQRGLTYAQITEQTGITAPWRLTEAGVERYRAYRAANRDRIAEKKRAYREANRSRVAGKCRAYYEANKVEIAEKKRAYRAANRDRIAEKKRAYREANKTPCLDCGQPSVGLRCRECYIRQVGGGGAR